MQDILLLTASGGGLTIIASIFHPAAPCGWFD
jgi:hypothetical protein